MRIARRQFLQGAGAAAAVPVATRFAYAQGYPARQVRVIVPIAPGGAADISARLMAQWLAERLGQSFVVENRPGGSNNIGTEAVIRSSADGYTLLLANPVNAINATLYNKLNFNFIADTTAVGRIMQLPLVVVVNPKVPISTVPELIAYAKANPGKINMASGGNGATGHVAGELFKMQTGVNMVHVPYRGEAPALVRRDRRAGAADHRHHPVGDWLYPRRRAPCAGGYDHRSGHGAARGAGDGGFRARL